MLSKARRAHLEATRALTAPFRLIPALIRLIHGMFELIGEFADKPVQRPVPLRTDLKAIHTLTEDAQKASRSAYSHCNWSTTEQREVDRSAERTRFDNHSGNSTRKPPKREIVSGFTRGRRPSASARSSPLPLLDCGGAGRPPTVARPAPTGPTPHQPHTPRDRRLSERVRRGYSCRRATASRLKRNCERPRKCEPSRPV